MVELSELNSYQEASLFCSDLSEWQEGPAGFARGYPYHRQHVFPPQALFRAARLYLHLAAGTLSAQGLLRRVPRISATQSAELSRRGEILQGEGTLQPLHDAHGTRLQEIERCQLLCRADEHHLQVSFEYREAGNGSYAQNYHRPVCGAPAEDAAQALRPEHQGDGMGISFC